MTFANGSLPNGDFMCAMISSEVYMKAMMAPPHLPANYINHKIIISKIYSENDGLNTSTTLVFDLDKKTAVWIDPVIAISKNEIVIK